MNNVCVYLGSQRGEGSPIEGMSLRPFLVVFSQIIGVGSKFEV